jgi:hypothetical protein
MNAYILKESSVSEEETLEHCLTVIQGLLDIDDFNQAYKYLYGYLMMAIAQENDKAYKRVVDYIANN